MPWIVRDDGSFDLETPFGALRNAFPALDGQSIRVLAVSVERSPGLVVARYRLTAGSVELRFHEEAGRLRLGARIQDLAASPHWFHPLHGGRLEGITRLFRQGIGFSGPTGFLAVERTGPWSSESWMLAGMGSDQGLLVVAPHRHREWVFKTEWHDRVHRDCFRARNVVGDESYADVGFAIERVELAGGVDLPDLHVTWDADAFTALRAVACDLAVANRARVRAPAYHYCSWYHHTEHYSQELLAEVLAGLEDIDPQRRMTTVQIDDGYMTSHGDWLDFKPREWPGGLEPAFRAIADSGRVPGVWVAPFMVGSASRLAAEHPDWLLKGLDGKPLVEWRHYDGHKRDFEHYVLDSSHPDALAWVREVFTTFRRWGARFFKTDFMEWGFKDSTRVRRFRPGRTSAAYFDEALATIRGAIGDDSTWLGCIIYFAPCLGWCDQMRVSSDVGLSWNGPGGTGNDGTGGGTQNMIEESFATQYFNNVLWQNDPDVVHLRDVHTHLSDAERDALACWDGILGSSVNTSDEVHRLSTKRQAWWRFLRPGPTPVTATLPYFDRPHRHRIAVRAYPDLKAWAVLVLNDRTEATCDVATMRELVGLDRAACFRWGPELREPLGVLDRLVSELPGHRHELIYVSADGTPPPADLTLGGARG